MNALKLNAKFAEKMQVIFKPFSRDRVTNVTVQAPDLAGLLEEVRPGAGKELPVPRIEADLPSAAGFELAARAVVMPDRIGIVKAWDLLGTRVHVEFVLLNDTERLVAIRNIVLLVGPGCNPVQTVR